MPILFHCPRCKARITAPDMPGRQVRCPECKQFTPIPKEEFPPVELAVPDEEQAERDEPAEEPSPKARSAEAEAPTQVPWGIGLAALSVPFGLASLVLPLTPFLWAFALPTAAFGIGLAIVGARLEHYGPLKYRALGYAATGFLLSFLSVVAFATVLRDKQLEADQHREQLERSLRGLERFGR